MQDFIVSKILLVVLQEVTTSRARNGDFSGTKL